MEYERIRHIVQTGDLLALFVGLRIAAGRHADAAGGIVRPLDVDILELFVDNGIEDVEQVGVQSGQNSLRLRVAETSVVLDNTRALRGQHQTEVQHALERTAFLLHGCNSRLEDGLHALGSNVVGVEAGRRECAHTAGVRAFVMIVGTLVILCGRHGLEVFAVYEGEHGNLRAGEELLDNDTRTGAAECAAVDRVLDRLDGFFLGHGNGNTLAERKAVRLDNDWRAVLLDVRDGIRRVLKNGVASGRNAVFLHQILGKGLAALNNSGVLARTEGTDACGLERVYHAECKRVVRCDHNEIRLVLLGESNHAVDVGCLNRYALCLSGNAAVARRTPDVVNLGALLQCMDDGVLTAAAADNQNFHLLFLRL